MDLGHVTFGSVSDWSEEQEQTLKQDIASSTITEEVEDDDGTCRPYTSTSICSSNDIVYYQMRSLPLPLHPHQVK